jgi:glutamyl endopeptidase
MMPQLGRYTLASMAMLLTWSSVGDNAFAQQVQDPQEAELNSPVSNAGEPGPALPGPGGGGGEASFSGAEGEAANNALAEFGAMTESANEVWELWSLPPATAPIGIETIIPPDTRTQVTNTTTFPERAVALITFDGGRCTGWLYGRDVVATAGHCVHEGGSGGNWHTNVRVYPGRNGSSSPYGSCSAKSLHSVTGWTQNRDERYDYGVVKLNCLIGNTTGWFGFWWQGATLNGSSTIISGYPGDKPLEHWRSTDQVRATEAEQAFYQNDTVGGMSGSPVFANRPPGSPFCAGYCVMGIHAYGLHGAAPHSNNNHGTRFTEVKVNNLIAWRNLP